MPSDGSAAPQQPLPRRTILICAPPADCFCSGPKSFPELRRDPPSHLAAPRALLRPTPNGRSLMTLSPLLSKPVVMLYGSADVPLTMSEAENPFFSFRLAKAEKK